MMIRLAIVILTVVIVEYRFLRPHGFVQPYWTQELYPAAFLEDAVQRIIALAFANTFSSIRVFVEGSLRESFLYSISTTVYFDM